jgi:hypothetical protein
MKKVVPLTVLVGCWVPLSVVLDAQGGHHLPCQRVHWTELSQLGGVRSCLPPPHPQRRSVRRGIIKPMKHPEGVMSQSDAWTISDLALRRVLGSGVGSVELLVGGVDHVRLDHGPDAKRLPDADSACVPKRTSAVREVERQKHLLESAQI